MEDHACSFIAILKQSISPDITVKDSGSWRTKTVLLVNYHAAPSFMYTLIFPIHLLCLFFCLYKKPLLQTITLYEENKQTT